MENVRITAAVAVVLRALLDDPSEARYGYDLIKTTGYQSGKLYPILNRLEAAGWLTSEFEILDASSVGRPARRWYRLTGDALPIARQAVAELHQRLAPPTDGPGRFRPQGNPA